MTNEAKSLSPSIIYNGSVINFMFKHPVNPPAENSLSSVALEEKKMNVPEQPKPSPNKVDTSPAALRDLLEKNLKWSQIIYEQNRKLNNKLLWSAIAEFFRVLIIIIPLIAGVIYLPKLLRQFQATYGGMFKAAQSGKISPGALENILNILPLDGVQRDQLKTILK